MGINVVGCLLRAWRPKGGSGPMRAVMMSLLLACGGNAHASAREPAAAAPAAAAAGLRALAATSQAVTPQEAARQLMDFAETQFSSYFPSAQPTQSLPPFAYRYYPQTGVYLGVVVAPGLGYEHLGVYVMGGSFGNQPVFVGPLSQFITPASPDRLVRVHVGSAGTYGLTAGGELFATGIGFGCRLGDGTATDRPAPVSLGLGWTAVTGGEWMLALKDDGSLWGWGTGHFGNGVSMRCSPTKIGDGYRSAHAIPVGSARAVAVRSDGSLWLWSPAPERIGSANDWVDAVVGDDHVLALKADGSLWSFGTSIMGHELGRDSSGSSHDTPGRVGSARYRALGASLDTSYAITTSGELHGWGRSSLLWPLGDGGTADRDRPVAIGTGFASVHPGLTRVVALKTDGSLWAWGENGQFGGSPVGDGTRVPHYAPVRLAGDIESVSSSELGVIAIDRQGRTWGWGSYDFMRHATSGNFVVLSSQVPVPFDFFAP